MPISNPPSEGGNVGVETDPVVGAITGIVASDGAGNITSADGKVLNDVAHNSLLNTTARHALGPDGLTVWIDFNAADGGYGGPSFPQGLVGPNEFYVDYNGNIYTGGNVYATELHGDGSHLTGVAAVIPDPFTLQQGPLATTFSHSGISVTDAFGNTISFGDNSGSAGSWDANGNLVAATLKGIGAVIAGTTTATGTATTTFTVTIGQTMANTNYIVGDPAGLNALSAAPHFVTNKTTTTFDVVYLTGLTGAVAFDWMLTPSP